MHQFFFLQGTIFRKNSKQNILWILKFHIDPRLKILDLQDFLFVQNEFTFIQMKDIKFIYLNETVLLICHLIRKVTMLFLLR